MERKGTIPINNSNVIYLLAINEMAQSFVQSYAEINQFIIRKLEQSGAISKNKHHYCFPVEPETTLVDSCVCSFPNTSLQSA